MVEVDVGASVDAIWSVLVDVERWPQWTPTMTEVRLIDGHRVREGTRVRVRQPGLPPLTWTVDVLVAGRSFSWRTGLPGGRTRATHELVPIDDGTTRVVLGLRQTGVAAVLGWAGRRRIRRYVIIEARSLRRRCEQGAAATNGTDSDDEGLPLPRPMAVLARLTAAVCVASGVAHLALGARIVPGEAGTGATVDSRERFYGAVFLGYGLAWEWAARRTPTPAGLVQFLAGILLLGGVGRVISVVDRGRPHRFQTALTVVEFVLPPVFFRLAHQPARGRRPPR
jgi:hypothetical protein